MPITEISLIQILGKILHKLYKIALNIYKKNLGTKEVIRSIKRKKTDNTMSKRRKGTKGQTIV